MKRRSWAHPKVNHLDDAVAAVDVTLDEQEVERLVQPYRPRRVLSGPI